jgi:hypothetical protein
MKIVVTGLDKVQSFLKELPRGSRKAALKALGDYFLGDDAHGLRHYEPYKYVSRLKAYGKSFFTEKQRKWFWANGGPDMIGNNRTGESAGAWFEKETSGGYGLTLENKSEGGKWIWSNSQAAQPRKVGHRKAIDKVKSNMAGAMRSAQAAVNAFLKRR